ELPASRQGGRVTSYLPRGKAGELRITCLAARRASYELPASRQGGRITNYKLQITNYLPRGKAGELRITNYESQILK
ncbi:MAG: hypothetical protein LH629_13065, partial [Ignavibacteria bacterium]|nr:hypothetical protein [Ignavibacteria bacterium]